MTGEADLYRLGREEDRALECALGSTLLALYLSVAAPVAGHYAGAAADFLFYLLWAAWAITLSNWCAVRRIQRGIPLAAGGDAGLERRGDQECPE